MFKNKKGMMDDLFDFLFTVMLSVILFAVIFAMVNNVDKNYTSETLNEVQEKKFNDEIILLLQQPSFINKLDYLNDSNKGELELELSSYFKENYACRIIRDNQELLSITDLYSDGRGSMDIYDKKIIIKKNLMIFSRAYENE
jgi:hypothetical protein